MAIVSGNRTTIVETTDHLIDIEKGIKFLNPRDNGIKFVKKLLANGGGEVAKSGKHLWHETAIPVNRETITIDDSATALDVADANAYTVGDVLECAGEYMTVSALADANTLTVVRGALGGGAAAAHTAAVMLNLGSAVAESSTGVAGMSTSASELYNYVQTMEMAVDMSNDEIAELSSEIGNPFNKQLERITLAYWKRFANNVFYGIRNLTSSTRHMGGIDYFLSTNVTAVGGALTIAAIDAKILAMVNAGGYPEMIVLSPYQKQKLDALDAALQHLGKREHVGGQLKTNTWQSGILDYELDIMVDPTIKTSDLFILDMSKLSLIPKVHNGINGRLGLYDATANGADYKKTILRSKYTLKVTGETGLAKLETLS